MRCVPFSEQDDQMIQTLMAAGKSWVEIGQRLGRGEYSVRGRARRMGWVDTIPHREVKWSDDERALLAQNRERPLAEIVRLFPKRTHQAVKHRLLKEFGVSHKVTKPTERAPVGNPIGVPFRTASGIVAFKRHHEAVTLPHIPSIDSPGTSRPGEHAAPASPR